MMRHAVAINPFVYHTTYNQDIHYMILLDSQNILREWLKSHGYLDAAQALEKIESNPEFKSNWPYSSSANHENADMANFYQEIKLVWKSEISRIGKEMSDACRAIYHDLLELGYTFNQLNQPFDCLLKDEEKNIKIR